MNQILFLGTIESKVNKEVAVNKVGQSNKDEKTGRDENTLKQTDLFSEGVQLTDEDKAKEMSQNGLIDENQRTTKLKFISNIDTIKKELEDVRTTVQLNELVKVKKQRVKNAQNAKKNIEQPTKNKKSINQHNIQNYSKPIYVNTLLQREKSGAYNIKLKNSQN